MTESIVSRRELLTRGYFPSDIEDALRAGVLVRLRRGFYGFVDAADPTPHGAMIRSAVEAAGDNAVVSGWSAALLHGLPVAPGRLSRPWITHRGRVHGHVNEVRHSRLCPMDDDEITILKGLPVTNLTRTVADEALNAPLDWGVAVADAALGKGADRAELLAAVNRWPRRPYIRRARRAVTWADPRSGSVGESRSRVLMRLHGLPEPELQFKVFNGDRLLGIADFGWPELSTLGEFDGRIKYTGTLRPGESPEQAIMREKRREEAFRASGFWVVRWDETDLNSPKQLAARIRNAFKFGASLAA